MLRSVHSKQAHDARSPVSDTLSFNFPSSNPSYFKSPTNRQLLDDPSASILDLDDDVRSSMAFSERSNQYNSNDDDTNNSDSEEPLPRISYLGPKMRFHSRAPWEMEEEALDEEDETDTTSTSNMNIVSMLTGGRSRKSFSSNVTSRPSGESSHSQLNPKRSFDTSASHVSHPRGALYALAQESLSTSSLGKPPQSSGRQEGFRGLGKFSLGRFRSHSPNFSSPSSSNSAAINNRSELTPPLPPRTSYETSTALEVGTSNIRKTERRMSLPYSNEDVHPYANPDHVLSYPTAPAPRSPLRIAQNLPGMPRNDSNATVTDGLPPLMPKFSATPASSSIKRASHVHGKDISSPVTVLNNPSPAWQSDIHQQEPVPPVPIVGNSIPGWTERSINPGFSLISLEEARAQRNRVANAPPSLEADTSMASSHNATNDTSINSLASTLSETNLDNNARTRTRSISASAKAKSAFQSFVGPKVPERRDSEPTLLSGPATGKEKDVSTAGKALKHKKSGFMRLFGKDKDGISNVPPVPTLPDSHTLPRTRGLSGHRIPVPSISPSLLLEVGAIQDGDSTTESLHQGTGTSGSSPKRGFPLTLSIKTGSSTAKQHSAAYSTDAWASSTTAGAGPGSILNPNKDVNNVPQSAPAHITEFPALKLRPVSTLFSAQFGDHIVVSEPESNNDSAEENDRNEGRNDASVPFVQTNKLVGRNTQERQSSFASTSISASSFGDHTQLSPTASSYVSMSTAGTAFTTPTTGGGFMSPLTPGSWGYGARFSEQQQQQSLYPGGYPGVSAFSSSTLSVASRDRERERYHDPMNPMHLVKSLQEQLDVSSNAWQQKVWDLEARVRDLKDEIMELKKNDNLSSSGERCDACGRGSKAARRRDSCGSWDEMPMRSWQQQQQEQKQKQQQQQEQTQVKTGVLNRPRARTGASSRFVNAQM